MTWDEFLRWAFPGALTLVVGIVGLGVRTLLIRLTAQDAQLALITTSVTSLDQKVGLDLRGLDVRLSFIEGQLGIKK